MPLQLIPYDHGQAVTLQELAASIRGDRGGNCDPAVAYRWALHGVKLPDGTRMVLPTICLGRHRWLMRQWFDAWQAERGRLCVPTKKVQEPRQPRPSTHGHDRAVMRLRKAGFKIGGAA